MASGENSGILTGKQRQICDIGGGDDTDDTRRLKGLVHVDALDPPARHRRPHVVHRGHTVEQRVADVGDVGGAPSQERRVLHTPYAVAEDAHR